MSKTKDVEKVIFPKEKFSWFLYPLYNSASELLNWYATPWRRCTHCSLNPSINVLTSGNGIFWFNIHILYVYTITDNFANSTKLYAF